jgi:hypothetical protein
LTSPEPSLETARGEAEVTVTDAHGEREGLAMAVHPVARDSKATGRLAHVEQFVVSRRFGRDTVDRGRTCGEGGEDPRDPKHEDGDKLGGYLAGAHRVGDKR